MKKLMSFLLCAGAMSISASALALPTQAAFAVNIVSGPVGILAGVMTFDLDADLPGVRQCRYYYEWDNSAIVPISADGYLLETKTHGSASCLANGLMPVNSIVQADPTYPLTGFDRFQQVRPLSMFILGEDGNTANLSGLVQFKATPTSPPSFMTNSIELKPAI